MSEYISPVFPSSPQVFGAPTVVKPISAPAPISAPYVPIAKHCPKSYKSSHFDAYAFVLVMFILLVIITRVCID